MNWLVNNLKHFIWISKYKLMFWTRNYVQTTIQTQHCFWKKLLSESNGLYNWYILSHSCIFSALLYFSHGVFSSDSFQMCFIELVSGDCKLKFIHFHFYRYFVGIKIVQVFKHLLKKCFFNIVKCWFIIPSMKTKLPVSLAKHVPKGYHLFQHRKHHFLKVKLLQTVACFC